MDNKIAKKLRKDFPVFKNNPKLVYLDSSATSQKPKQVIKVFNEFIEKENANVSRGLYTLAEKAMEKYEKARKNVADFINVKEKEIVFTKNATESINLLSYTLKEIIPRGKNEILLTEMEHHSNLVPWQELAKREKMKLKFVKVKSNLILDLEDAKRKINSKTAIFAFTHISNVLGTINPVNKLVKLGKKYKAITMIDAAQSVPHIPVDFKKIGCDFAVFSSHKMLGPNGIGVLYGKQNLLEKLPPFNFGGGMIKNVFLEKSLFQDAPERFEAGTQNIAGAIGLSEAVNYLNKIGMKNVLEWENKLAKYSIKKLRKIQGVKIYAPDSNLSSGIVSFNLNGIHPHDISELLNREGIAVRAGHHCAMPLMRSLNMNSGGTVRISFSVYTTLEDIDKLVNVLNKINKIFNKK
ncbi:MAG: SufS family cysteine desulfurase [Candidatus Pacearchaeota archaeon]